MTYFERVVNAYRDSMMEMGVSEDVVNFCLYGFETGFRAGVLYNDDIQLQKEMVAAILNENKLN
jgi:hypothetical protein